MTEPLSSLAFEKGGNEGGSAFFITVPGQFPDLSKLNWIKYIAATCTTRKFEMVVAWWLRHILRWIRINNSRVNLVKWGISTALCRWLSIRFSLWSAQGNAALWLQQIYVIIFEVDIVAEQKQTYWSQFVCFYNFPLS